MRRLAVDYQIFALQPDKKLIAPLREAAHPVIAWPCESIEAFPAKT
jgi:hypothetical protein